MKSLLSLKQARFCRTILLPALTISVAILPPSLSYPKSLDCEWLQSFVNEQARPTQRLVDQKIGQKVEARIFPLAPADITLAIYHARDLPADLRLHTKKLVTSVLKETALPIRLVDKVSGNTHVVVSFFKRSPDLAATPELISEIQSLPQREKAYAPPDFYRNNRILVTWSCSSAGGVSANAELTEYTILVPVDEFTKEPTTDSKSCLTHGLLRALGAAWNPGPGESCDECDKLRFRIAKILHRNNGTTREKITSQEMVRRLSNGACPVDARAEQDKK